jgi:hypothetical protein
MCRIVDSGDTGCLLSLANPFPCSRDNTGSGESGKGASGFPRIVRTATARHFRRKPEGGRHRTSWRTGFLTGSNRMDQPDEGVGHKAISHSHFDKKDPFSLVLSSKTTSTCFLIIRSFTGLLPCCLRAGIHRIAGMLEEIPDRIPSKA